jgi:hypothetical protein
MWARTRLRGHYYALNAMSDLFAACTCPHMTNRYWFITNSHTEQGIPLHFNLTTDAIHRHTAVPATHLCSAPPAATAAQHPSISMGCNSAIYMTARPLAGIRMRALLPEWGPFNTIYYGVATAVYFDMYVMLLSQSKRREALLTTSMSCLSNQTIARCFVSQYGFIR